MAAITEYSPNIPGGPEFGDAVEASRQIGAGVYGVLSSAAESIGRHLDLQETSNLHVALTNRETKAFTDWENLKQNGDITDPEVREKFNENYTNDLQSLTNNINSPAVRQHANELIATATGDMQRRTLNDSSIAIGDRAAENYTGMLNSFSGMVAQDPTFLDEGARQLNFMIAGSGFSANQIPRHQIAAREQLAKSAIDGTANKAREMLADDSTGKSLESRAISSLGTIHQAIDDINNGHYSQYLDGTQLETSLKFLRQQETQIKEDVRTAGTLENKQKEEASHEAVTKYQQQLTQPNLDFTKWSGQILSDPAVTPSDRESAIRFGHFMIMEPILERQREARESRTEARATNAQRSESFWNAWAHVNSGDIDSPSQINDLATRHIIDLKALAKKGGPGGDPDAVLSKNFYDGARKKLEGLASPEGDPFHDNFAAVWQLDQQERSQVPPVPAAERYDPKSPKYVGKAFDQALNNANAPTTLDNAKPAAPAKAPIHYQNADVMDKAYAHMPSGTVFIGPDGKTRRKP